VSRISGLTGGGSSGLRLPSPTNNANEKGSSSTHRVRGGKGGFEAVLSQAMTSRCYQHIAKAVRAGRKQKLHRLEGVWPRSLNALLPKTPKKKKKKKKKKISTCRGFLPQGRRPKSRQIPYWGEGGKTEAADERRTSVDPATGSVKDCSNTRQRWRSKTYLPPSERVSAGTGASSQDDGRDLVVLGNKKHDDRHKRENEQEAPGPQHRLVVGLPRTITGKGL